MSGKGGKKKLSPNVVRIACLAIVFAIAVISAIFGTGAGTLSSMGLGAVAYLCPLGALESMFGAFAFIPRAAIALAAVLLLAFLVGRAFCSWVCPVPPLRDFFKTKKAKQADAEERAEASEASCKAYVEGQPSCESRKSGLDSRHVVLCGALGSAAIFGFPVFCLICPIGLIFATVVGVVRLVGFNEPSVSLLFFIAILLVELVFFRKWCSKICPVGALLSLLGKVNRTFRPQVDESKCLRTTQGRVCGACASACSELIDPQGDRGMVPIDECTRCTKCSEACPASAISFPMVGKKTNVEAEQAEELR